MILVEHPTWKIHDSAKLKCYASCPRHYFYRYVLGWRPEGNDLHQLFGKLWHESMEFLLLNGLTSENVIIAAEALRKKYNEVYDPMTDKEREPKTPGFAAAALAKYFATYATEKWEVLYTEIAGTVPISKDRVLHFKMDSILRREDQLILSLEHKTGSANSRSWRDSFKLSIQAGAYGHVLYCLYPEELVWGVEINGALFTKGKIVEFVRIPVRRTPKMMDVWLRTVNHLIEQIEEDFCRLEMWKDEEVLKAFHPIYTDCVSYSGCPFFDFCLTVSNPLRIQNLPEGLKVEYWNPAEVEAKHKVVL